MAGKELYQVVGQNNRNILVQSKRVAPYHEDLTRVTTFENSSLNPGELATLRLDLKHATDRELILNDLRLRFKVDFSARTAAGKVQAVLATRMTDFIRELRIKINEDEVFKVDRQGELSLLWEMNNHQATGMQSDVANSPLMCHGNIPSGKAPPLYPDTTNVAAIKEWYFHSGKTYALHNLGVPYWTFYTMCGEERHDGLPRIIFDDNNSPTETYIYQADISLNQLVGPIFQKLHLRRIEFIQIEIRFEPWVSAQETQKICMFMKDPTINGTVAHPYSVVKFTGLEVQQYRTTLLDCCTTGFTLPDNRMLSWLMHRFTWRDYPLDLSKDSMDIQLHDFEIRTNIVRVWWTVLPQTKSAVNWYAPTLPPGHFGNYYGSEILWQNDKVLDLDDYYKVQRHYVLSHNKRYGVDEPFMKFYRLHPNTLMQVKNDSTTAPTYDDGDVPFYTWDCGLAFVGTNNAYYEVPMYYVDLNMNIQVGCPGAEIIGGIVNDTANYVVRIKKIKTTTFGSMLGAIPNLDDTNLTLRVFLEYQTLVNLAAGSNQFARGSQVVTKQLNL